MEQIVTRQGRRGVLVSSGYQNNTDYMASTTAIYFFQSSGSYKSKIKASAGLVSSQASDWLADAPLLAMSSHGRLCAHPWASVCVSKFPVLIRAPVRLVPTLTASF